MTSATGDHHDDYVNGRAAEKLQADRARDHAPPGHEGPDDGASDPPAPSLMERLGRMLRRLSGRSRSIRRPVTAGILTGVLLLAACGSDTEEPATTTERTDTPEDAETPEQTAPAADAGDGAADTAVCEDPVDDGAVVDQEANDGYEGDAYTADQVRIQLSGQDDTIRLQTQENRDKIDTPPAGPLRFDLWLVSEEGETGLVRATAPSPTAFIVEAGPDEDSLEPVEGGSPRFGAPGSFLLNIDRDLLPVLEGPFGWALVEIMEGNGTADICPNDASVDDPLADPAALIEFPG